MSQTAATNGHDAAFFHSSADVVICAAEGSGNEITIKRARDSFHYRGGNMDGGPENIIRIHNTATCNHCQRCIS